MKTAPSTTLPMEATVDSIARAYRSGELSCRELVQHYLDRIDAYDRGGPQLNSVINIQPQVLERADELDAIHRSSGPVGPLHGVPVLLKDQIDSIGTPTTLGSVLLEDYSPDRDAFVVERLKQAGAIMLAKTTLGELGGGDTHGTLFGSTRNPYSPDRTVGGSSGGTGAAVSANLGALGLGLEGLASIHRPAAWNSIVGMRPTAGLVSRSGVFSGWPGVHTSLGPMTRTVRDLAALLDAMVGYDPEDPLTALGVGRTRESYASCLDEGGLSGARVGVLRESMGRGSEPHADDFKDIERVFSDAVDQLREAGASLVDPIEIPGLHELLAQRSSGRRGGSEAAFQLYFDRSSHRPFSSFHDLLRSPGYEPMGSIRRVDGEETYDHLRARETLTLNLMQVMADNELDAIVHRTVEHEPTPIRDGLNPPYSNMKGATHLNTFLVYVPSLTVPAGFSSSGLPVGMSLLGRPYSDQRLTGLAFAYEQATNHRRPPPTTPPLHDEP